MIEIADHSFSMADLLGSGMASDMVGNSVAEAVSEIEQAPGRRSRAAQPVRSPDRLTGLLDTEWERVWAAAIPLSGTSRTKGDKVDLGNTPN